MKIILLLFCCLSLGSSAEELRSDSPVTYREVEPIIQGVCAKCHKGPYLDLTSFPFFSDKYPTPEALVTEMVRRVQLQDLKRMPPVSFPALQAEEIELLKAWLRDGVQGP